MITDVFQTQKTVFSFEVFPPKKDSEIYDIYKTLDTLKLLNPDFISVTYGAGGSNSKKTAVIAAYIKNICEIEAIAHITSVAMDEAFLLNLIDDLNQKGVHNVLALRGDRPKNMSDEEYNHRTFLHASDIIPIIHAHSDSCIAAACYPEIHPDSPNMDSDLKYLKLKVDSGVNFLITQMFFDNDKFFYFRDKARKIGVHVPISTGIMPITSANQLGTSVKLSGSSVPQPLTNLIAKYGSNPADMRKAGIEYAINQIRGLMKEDVDGIHLYTMNKTETAQEIMAEIRRRESKE